MPTMLLALGHARAILDAGPDERLRGSPDDVSGRPQRCNRTEKNHESETETSRNWPFTVRPLNGFPIHDPAVIAAGAGKLVALGVEKAKKQIKLAEPVSELRLEVCCLVTARTILLLWRAQWDDSLPLSNHEHHDDLP